MEKKDIYVNEKKDHNNKIEKVTLENPKIKFGIICNSETVNAREKNSSYSRVAKVLLKGTKVTILEETDNGYFKIVNPASKFGPNLFVKKDYCKMTNS